MKISEEAKRQRVANMVAPHKALALEAKARIDFVIHALEKQALGIVTGEPTDDMDAELNTSFDNAVLAIEKMREQCVDAPAKPKPEPVKAEVESDSDEDSTCVNLLATKGTVAIFGGEIDTQKLERIRESTGLGSRLIWYPNPSVYRLISSVGEGGTSCVVLLTSLMAHSMFNALQTAYKKARIPTYNIRKPGINTIIAALEELDEQMVESLPDVMERKDHPRIRGPYKRDPLAARWYADLRTVADAVPLGATKSASELLNAAGMEPFLGDGEKRRLTAVMVAFGWKRQRLGSDPTYIKLASSTVVLSESKG